MEIKRIAVLTSGGDAPGMNAAIRAVVRSALDNNVEVYGVYDGYKGLYEDNMEKLDRHSVSNIINRGGTFLGTARFEKFTDPSYRQVAINNMKKRNIDALVVLGGDGTYHGGQALSEMRFPCVGVPATIDNDIASTQYTIGFDTTLNTIIDCIDKIKDTSSSHRRCSVVEVMGRHNPELAIRAGIACGAEFIIGDKESYSKEKLLEAVRDAKKNNKRNCIIIACEHTIPVTELAKVLNDDGQYETRSSVLGYIQRGGTPSAFDRVLAAWLSEYAVELLLKGVSGVCVGTNGTDVYHMSFEENFKLPKKDFTEEYKRANRLI